MSSQRLSLRAGGVLAEFGGELVDATGDLVSCGAHLVDGPAFGVWQFPVDVAFAGDEWGSRRHSPS